MVVVVCVQPQQWCPIVQAAHPSRHDLKYTVTQMAALDEAFRKDKALHAERRRQLAQDLGLSELLVNNWCVYVHFCDETFQTISPLQVREETQAIKTEGSWGAIVKPRGEVVRISSS